MSVKGALVDSFCHTEDYRQIIPDCVSRLSADEVRTLTEAGLKLTDVHIDEIDKRARKKLSEALSQPRQPFAFDPFLSGVHGRWVTASGLRV